MNSDMILKCSLFEKEGFDIYSQAINLSVYDDVFEPIKSTDVPMLAYALGECTTAAATAKKQIRKDAAQKIGMAIAEALVRALETRDTHNGYPIKRLDPCPRQKIKK